MPASNVVEIIIRAKDQASKQLKATKDSVSLLKVTAAGAFIQIAKDAARAARAITRMVNAGSQLADQIGDMSKKLNVSAETLSTLRLAANVTGSSIDAMATGIKTLNRQALVAAQGSKSLAELFARLDVTIRDAQGGLRPTEQLLNDIADGMAKVASKTERAAIAQTLFGGSGSDLIPILGEGSAKLKIFRDRAAELGVVIDGQATAKADLFQDSLVQVKEATIGLSLVIGEELLPELQPLVTTIISLTTQFARWIKETDGISKAGRVVAGTFQFMAIMGRMAVEVAQRYVNVLSALALISFKLKTGALGDIPDILKAAVEQDREIVKETAKFIDALAKAEQAAKDFNTASNEVAAGNNAVGQSFQIIQKEIEKEEMALAKLTAAHLKSVAAIEIARLEVAGRMREAENLRFEHSMTLIEQERETEQKRLMDRRAEIERTITDEEALKKLRFSINEQLLANDQAANDRRIAAQDRVNKRIIDQWESVGVNIADNAAGVVASVLEADMTAKEGLRKIGEDALKAILNQFIDNTLKELLVAQLAETAKAVMKGPLSFGASLAALIPIAATYAGARGAVSALKLQKGGLVAGGTIGRDSVPALLEPGELVLPRPLTSFLRSAFSGGPRSGAMQEGGVAGGGGTGLTISIGTIENVSDMRYVDILIDRLNDLVENHGRRLVSSEVR